MSSCSNCGSPKLNAYILLDRSGSMVDRWSEALGSINAYVEGLAKSNASVTLATFDAVDGIKFDMIRDHVSVSEWKPVDESEVCPRGGTPLFDAVVRVVALAETANETKTVVVVMTDGEENSSREAKKSDAKLAADRCRAKGWEVIFLGADFDACKEASSVGVGYSKVMRLAPGSYRAAMSNLSSKCMDYSVDGTEVAFNENDRLVASGQASSTTN